VSLFAVGGRMEVSLSRPVHITATNKLPVSVEQEARQAPEWIWTFLGAFAKLLKATVSFVMSVCRSIRPQGKTRLPLDGFT